MLVRLISATTALLCAMAVLLANGTPLRAQTPAPIRVGLARSVESATIGADGPVDVTDVEAGRRDTQEGGRLMARATMQGLDLAGLMYGVTIRLQPRAGFLHVNGRPYRGVIEIRRTAQSRLTVINEVDLEEYLYGVVRSEMDPRWPPEALRAQAIAARSLATYSLGRYAAEGFDVRPTTETQVYGGVAAEDPRASAAVEATRGQIMLYEGRPVFAAYHTDSGGATENSEFVWGSVTPYLRGVADPFSRDAPNHEWTVRLDLPMIETRLPQAPIGALQRIEVIARSPSGRALTLRLWGAEGAITMRGTDFRTALGVGVLRSTLFAARSSGEMMEFAGRGYGHGVGMSQWGARGQAAVGREAPEILRYYYSGVTIGPRP